MIKISGRRQEDTFVQKVEDNGIGIDLNKHGKQLFKPFTASQNKVMVKEWD